MEKNFLNHRVNLSVHSTIGAGYVDKSAKRNVFGKMPDYSVCTDKKDLFVNDSLHDYFIFNYLSGKINDFSVNVSYLDGGDRKLGWACFRYHPSPGLTHCNLCPFQVCLHL